MKHAAWREVSIGRQYDREAFDCGEPALNEFLRLRARKSHEVGGSKTFLAVDATDEKAILGYYTLCPASLRYELSPEVLRRSLARYDVPVFRLARLAVDLRAQGRGLGGQLLLAAGERCLRVASEVGGVALLIDAKDERAAVWYRRFGAVPLQDAPLTLVLPLKVIEAALRAGGVA